MRRCNICVNYLPNEENCSLCQFEYDENLFWTNDDEWDILEMDDDYEWSHLQLLYRLYAKNIDCLFADIWFDSNIAFMIGVKATEDRVAEAFGVHKEVIYNDFEHGLMIVNLFQEKYLRGMLDD